MFLKKSIITLAVVFCLSPSVAGCSDSSASELPKESVSSEIATADDLKVTHVSLDKSVSGQPISLMHHDTEISAAVQEANLKTGTYNLNSVEFTMILVEGGTFTMGNDERARGKGTQVSNQAGEHQVTVSSFLIGETEVTRALWDEVMSGRHSDNDLNYPVASITVPECRTFVEHLNEKAHATGIIPAEQNFHLLTEAQWEFAARGGNKSQGYTYAGSNTLSEVGWTSSDGGNVHAVKLKKPNELGIYDMSGNVYEWVADYAAPYSTEAQTDPCNLTSGNDYIKRGGSFYYNDDYRFTCSYRYFYSSTDYTIGLRIGLY